MKLLTIRRVLMVVQFIIFVLLWSASGNAAETGDIAGAIYTTGLAMMYTALLFFGYQKHIDRLDQARKERLVAEENAEVKTFFEGEIKKAQEVSAMAENFNQESH